MNAMKNALKFFALVLILAIPLGFISSYRTPSKKTKPQTQVQGSQSRVIEVFQIIASSEAEKIVVDQGITALELLEQTAQVKKQGEGKGAFVTSIDNLEASKDKKEYWAFYVNGQLSPVGAGSYQLSQGNKIEWKLANY